MNIGLIANRAERTSPRARITVNVPGLQGENGSRAGKGLGETEEFFYAMPASSGFDGR
jgi:hypothetical protein